mmetsp:Transcript_38142/g.68959  ORF Transcript_38142/g.68959 Transcript_38142/m.68959 type:complete len:251 (-) Transcript_38142:160-912(-)
MCSTKPGGFLPFQIEVWFLSAVLEFTSRVVNSNTDHAFKLLNRSSFSLGKVHCGRSGCSPAEFISSTHRLQIFIQSNCDHWLWIVEMVIEVSMCCLSNSSMMQLLCSHVVRKCRSNNRNGCCCRCNRCCGRRFGKKILCLCEFMPGFYWCLNRCLSLCLNRLLLNFDLGVCSFVRCSLLVILFGCLWFLFNILILLHLLFLRLFLLFLGLFSRFMLLAVFEELACFAIELHRATAIFCRTLGRFLRLRHL